jgi:REP element-mobilizing transposase RayT
MGMGWPLRMFQEEGFYFVTSRCFQGRLLLRPSAEVNEVVGGVLAKAVQQSAGNVRLHAFTFASNHFHLLVWARGAALAAFMQYLRANLSKKVGRLVDWSGGFWERRYSAEPVLDDAALVGRLRYVLAHGVKEGLVERSAEWPGLTCLPQLLGPARRLFQWFNWTTGRHDCLPAPRADCVDERLPMVPLFTRGTIGTDCTSAGALTTGG